MKIFINNKEYSGNENDTVIQVADKQGIHIPRFCYHKHLSIVASCRMCLVEVEGFKKAQPACSTTIKEDMKVFTNSEVAKGAQKATMEFLLINHPLDCPICDQGGECELQDISLTHGKDHSDYTELKRVVLDRDISPLISTDMTRCIHCSRCVRFGEEISSCKELGLLDRTERMKIDTFIDQGVSSELSGNMIDLCPVGALNNKPYRYSARTWDLSQLTGISPHDCIGSNISFHVYDNKIVRAVPKENEKINQTWISDRDRFGYEGIYSNDRATVPMIRKNGKLIECDWDIAIDAANKELEKITSSNIDDIGCLITPQSTCEELYLFQKLFKGLNIKNIDHRTNEVDYSYQENFPTMPLLGTNLNEIDSFENILLVGVNIKREFPILSPRIIKSTKNKTKVFSFNFLPSYEDFPLQSNIIFKPNDLEEFFNNFIKLKKSSEPSSIIDKGLRNLNINKKTLIIIGPSISQLHNQTGIISSVKNFSNQTNSSLGFLADHCNSTSSWLFGVLPHRNMLGEKSENSGLTAYEMVEKRLSSYILYNLEPEHDFWNNVSLDKSLEKSKMNIFFSSFITPSINKHANILMPITTFAESDGSFINIEGTYQKFKKIVNSRKGIKPGYSVLSDLINKNNLGDYTISSLQKEIENKIVNFDVQAGKAFKKNPKKEENKVSDIYKFTERSIYQVDSLSRRSPSLQMTKHAKNSVIKVSKDIVEEEDKKKQYIEIIDQFTRFKTNTYSIDNSLPEKTIIYPSSFFQGNPVGSKSGRITVKDDSQ
ncbi:MAG: NADH-quinone oxidoreductase subunit NuoG [Pseudomonadota bacterium]|nr:NADH-quinone oxidoreductase subunit NuoG [Pseudomonadota bacterium]